MKYYFVINPIAGKANQTESLSQELNWRFNYLLNMKSMYRNSPGMPKVCQEK